MGAYVGLGILSGILLLLWVANQAVEEMLQKQQKEEKQSPSRSSEE